MSRFSLNRERMGMGTRIGSLTFPAVRFPLVKPENSHGATFLSAGPTYYAIRNRNESFITVFYNIGKVLGYQRGSVTCPVLRLPLVTLHVACAEYPTFGRLSTQKMTTETMMTNAHHNIMRRAHNDDSGISNNFHIHS